jgi:hypothetical protein
LNFGNRNITIFEFGDGGIMDSGPSGSKVEEHANLINEDVASIWNLLAINP